MAKTIKSAKDLRPDPNNANEGTDRGRDMLERSMLEVGAARSIVADSQGVVLAGNKTYRAAERLGIPIRVVETDGSELVVVQRTDLDLSGDDENKARQLAYYDNRTSQVGLKWDVRKIIADVDAKKDMSGQFHDWELDKLMGSLAEKPARNDPNAEYTGMPEFEQNDLMKPTHVLKVHFLNEADLEAFAALVCQPLTTKTKYIWYPRQDPADLKALGYEDES